MPWYLEKKLKEEYTIEKYPENAFTATLNLRKIIDDNDIFILRLENNNDKINVVYSDCDRYRFEAWVVCNENYTEFMFDAGLGY